MASTINWQEVQPNLKWRILMKQKRFAAWAVFSSLGSMMLGFDYGVAGTVTAFPAFQQQMGIPYPSQPSGYLITASIQSAWSGVSTAGHVVGVMLGGFLLDFIGRKHTLGVGAVLTAAGIGIQVGSLKWRVFLAGRLINAIGFGSVFVVSPVWIGETVRPELRGFFLCITNGSIVFAQFLLSLVAYGAANIEGDWSYMTVLVIQFLFPAILLAVYPFFPESPYYFIKKGKPENARKSLHRIHGGSDQPLLDCELNRINEDVVVSEQMKALAAQGGPSILQCFKGSNLKRTLIAILPAAGQQFIGAAFVLGYVTYFMSLLGVTEFFTVSVILYVVMLLSNISAFFFIETSGRRWILVYGMVALTAIELLMGIMGCVTADGALWVIVVCIFLWAIAYQLSIGAIGFALAAEIPTPRLRASTFSLVGATQGVTGWLIGFVSPYMINPDAGNLGAKVGFVFFGFGLPLCILFFFFIPETKGLSFDDLDYLFNRGVSCRAFQKEIREHRLRGTEAAVVAEGGEKNTTTSREVEKPPSRS